jgi:hypothetical protein
LFSTKFNRVHKMPGSGSGPGVQFKIYAGGEAERKGPLSEEFLLTQGSFHFLWLYERTNVEKEHPGFGAFGNN